MSPPWFVSSFLVMQCVVLESLCSCSLGATNAWPPECARLPQDQPSFHSEPRGSAKDRPQNWGAGLCFIPLILSKEWTAFARVSWLLRGGEWHSLSLSCPWQPQVLGKSKSASGLCRNSSYSWMQAPVQNSWERRNTYGERGLMGGCIQAAVSSFLEIGLCDLLTINSLSHNSSHSHFHCQGLICLVHLAPILELFYLVNYGAAGVMRGNHFVDLKALCTCEMCDVLHLLGIEDICIFQFPRSVWVDISSEWKCEDSESIGLPLFRGALSIHGFLLLSSEYFSSYTLHGSRQWEKKWWPKYFLYA